MSKKSFKSGFKPGLILFLEEEVIDLFTSRTISEETSNKVRDESLYHFGTPPVLPKQKMFKDSARNTL